MEKNVLYSEVQRFNQWWIWLPLIGFNAFIGYGVIMQVVLNNQFGDKPMSNLGLILFFGLSIALLLLFMFIRLETIVGREGIFIRFYPFNLKYRYFKWVDVQRIYIRKYRPLFEYGGWGIKYSIIGKGKAITISGNIGLQIEFRNGEKLLIGTQNPDHIRIVLEEFRKYNL